MNAAPGSEPAALSLPAIPLDDPLVYAAYATGELGEEYFLDKPWLRRYARWLKPTTFDDLTALFMPWKTSDFRHIRLAEYIRRRLGKEEAIAPIPELESLLQDACGLLIYREQAAGIFHHIGGCPVDTAAQAVRAFPAWGLSWIVERTGFLAGAVMRGYSEQTVASIIALMKERMGLLVMKSWCVSQALVSYQAVYSKVHGSN